MANEVKIKVTADTRDAQTALKQGTKTFDDFRESVKRAGPDFSNLRGDIKGWITQLKAATPENEKFAERISYITSAYKAGSISADQARKALERIERQMPKVADETEKMVKQTTSAVDVMTSLKSAIDLATGTADKLRDLNDQFFEMGRAGANVLQTEQSFDGLIQKIGATNDLLERLRAAAKGTIDDQKLMSATTTLLAGAEDGLALSLANATPRLLEIAKAANKLNPTLGDTAFLYESIATGIKRGSPMILDNLGITIKIGEANEKYAKALGKTVPELTATETKQALLNATLEAGNILMEQAGGSADAYVDSITRMEVAEKNRRDAQAKAIAPFAVFLAQVEEEQWRLSDVTKTTTLKWIPALQGIQQFAVHAAAAVNVLTGKTEQLDDTLETVIPSVSQLSTNPVGAWAERSAQGMDTLNLSVSNSLSRWLEYRNNLESIAALQQQIGQATIDVKTATDNFGKSMGGEVLQALKDAGVKGADYDAVLGTLDTSLGTNYQLQKDQAAAIKAAVDEYKKTDDVAAFGKAITDLKDQFAPFDEAVKKASDRVFYLNLQLDQLERRQINIDVNVNQHGNVPTVGPLQGGNPAPTGGPVGPSSTPPKSTTTPMDRYASGGSFMVPPGYANDSYPLGGGRFAQSGETVTISPTININQSPGQSADALANAVIGKLGRMVSGARRNGSRSIGM